MNGILLLAIGGAWNEVRLPHPVKVTAYWTALACDSIAAAFGTAANSPITSTGHRGQPWQESFVAMGFLTVTIAMIATSVLVLWGLRGTPAEVKDSWKPELNIPQERKEGDHEDGHRATPESQSSNGAALVLLLTPVLADIGQSRNAILVRHGFDLVELPPFQIHPEISSRWNFSPPRTNRCIACSQRGAKEAGLPLNWPPHLPNSRPALAAACRMGAAISSRESLRIYTGNSLRRTLFLVKILRIRR